MHRCKILQMICWFGKKPALNLYRISNSSRSKATNYSQISIPKISKENHATALHKVHISKNIYIYEILPQVQNMNAIIHFLHGMEFLLTVRISWEPYKMQYLEMHFRNSAYSAKNMGIIALEKGCNSFIRKAVNLDRFFAVTVNEVEIFVLISHGIQPYRFWNDKLILQNIHVMQRYYRWCKGKEAWHHRQTTGFPWLTEDHL